METGSKMTFLSNLQIYIKNELKKKIHYCPANAFEKRVSLSKKKMILIMKNIIQSNKSKQFFSYPFSMA